MNSFFSMRYFGNKLIFYFGLRKYIIVYSALLNPCTYSVATLKGTGLRDIDIARGFALMVRRNITAKSKSKPESKSGPKSESKSEEESTGFPFTADQLIKELYRGPVNDLYNVIYLTVKSTCTIKNHGYAATNSETLAAKNWSLASDWEALITGDVIAKQMLMGMIIHRITGSKLVI